MRLTKLFALIVLTVLPLFAAGGSGLWIKVGASKIGPHSEKLDIRSATYVYDQYYIKRSSGSVWADSIMRANFINSDFFFQADISPAVTAGYEHSLNPVFSFSAGLGIRFPSSSFKFEQGSKTTYNSNFEVIAVDSNNLSLKIVNSFTNLVVPLEAKVMLPLSWGGFYLTAGPEFSFMLGAKYKVDAAYTITKEKDENSEVDVSDSYKSFSMGFGFKLGGEAAIGKHTLFFESGYMGGLTNIAEDEDLEMKNGEITLLQLGFKFSTGK